MSLYFLTPKACVCTNMAQIQSASGRTGKAEHFHGSQLQISWLRGKKLSSEIQIYEGICTLTDFTQDKSGQEIYLHSQDY